MHSKSSPSAPLSRHEIDDYLREYKINIGKDDRKKTVRYINAFKEYFKGSLVETTKIIKDKNGKDVSVPAWYLASEYGPNFGGGNFSIGETSLLIDMLTGMENRDGAGYVVANQRDRGKFYQNYALSLLTAKNCVGWHWFLYDDNEGLGSNKGIIDVNGKPFNELVNEMKKLNDNIYPLVEFIGNTEKKR